MLRRLSSLLVVGCALSGSVVIDRIAVVVGKHAIKTSDIDRDVRATQFLNHERPDFSVDTKRKAAERLIDQTLIGDEMEKGRYARSGAGDLDAMFKRLLQDRFGGSAARMKDSLSEYGLGEDQLRMQLQWQLDVMRFIEERFRPGVLVTDDEVRSYYDARQADLKRQFPQLRTYEALAPKIRTSLEGERLNGNFEQWLTQVRQRNRVEYRQGAFQ
jgi:peptidyl-prolyl cis-trans isomerase SurA